jgi:hypothetical protein
VRSKRPDCETAASCSIRGGAASPQDRGAEAQPGHGNAPLYPRPMAMPLAFGRGIEVGGAATNAGATAPPLGCVPVEAARTQPEFRPRPGVHRSDRGHREDGRRGKPVQILTEPTRLTEKKPRRAFDWWGGTGCPVSFDPTGPPCRSGPLLRGRLRLKIMKGAGIVLPPCGRRWPR